MKRIVPILLVILLLLQSFSKLEVWFGFSLNQSMIEKTLCENRNNPTKHCHGKCHLRKELKKQENAEKRVPNQNKEEGSVFIVHSLSDFSINDEYINVSLIQFDYHSSCLLRENSPVFHPPLCA